MCWIARLRALIRFSVIHTAATIYRSRLQRAVASRGCVLSLPVRDRTEQLRWWRVRLHFNTTDLVCSGLSLVLAAGLGFAIYWATICSGLSLVLAAGLSFANYWATI